MDPVIIVFIPWNYSGKLKNFLFNPCRKLAKRPFGQKCFFTITRNNWQSPIVCVEWSWTDILRDLGLHWYSEREGDNVTQAPWTFWNLSTRLWSQRLGVFSTCTALLCRDGQKRSQRKPKLERVADCCSVWILKLDLKHSHSISTKKPT